MNYMKQVADMLGVRLEEEFKIEGYPDDVKFKFDELSLEYLTNGEWYCASGILEKLLNGEFKLIKLSHLLTEKEKEYLSAVVKPFRDEVKHISKNHYDDEEWIQIRTKSGLALLPPFKEGLMYKGMKVSKEYALEEFGL